MRMPPSGPPCSFADLIDGVMLFRQVALIPTLLYPRQHYAAIILMRHCWSRRMIGHISRSIQALLSLHALPTIRAMQRYADPADMAGVPFLHGVIVSAQILICSVRGICSFEILLLVKPLMYLFCSRLCRFCGCVSIKLNHASDFMSLARRLTLRVAVSFSRVSSGVRRADTLRG